MTKADTSLVSVMTAAHLMHDEPDDRIAWVVPYVLAAEATTLVIGGPKTSGKTTLALRWAWSLLHGQPWLETFPAPTPGRVLYYTEEPRATFRQALRRADLTTAHNLLVLFGREFSQRVPHWPTQCKHLAQIAVQHNIRLIVLDTFSQLAGLAEDQEKDSGAVAEALAPVQQYLGSTGASILLTHHEKKHHYGGNITEAARGSSALPGGVDIVLRLTLARGKQDGPFAPRRLRAIGRFDETPEWTSFLRLDLAKLEGLPERWTHAELRDHTKWSRASVMRWLAVAKSMGFITIHRDGPRPCYSLAVTYRAVWTEWPTPNWRRYVRNREDHDETDTPTYRARGRDSEHPSDEEGQPE